jgi:hypothetical protein
MRNQALQEFLDAARTAYSHCARDPKSIALLERAFSTLEVPAQGTQPDSGRLPVCRYLPDITEPSDHDAPELRQVMQAFRGIEPTLGGTAAREVAAVQAKALPRAMPMR